MTFLVHVLDDADEQTNGDIAAQRPRMIPVAHDVTEVREGGEHSKVPEILVVHFDGFAVDSDRHAAKEAQLESCGCDDDVCIKLIARVQLDASFCDGLDSVGNNGSPAAFEAFEVVPIWAVAQALLPREVARLQIGVDGEVFWELLLRFGAQ